MHTIFIRKCIIVTLLFILCVRLSQTGAELSSSTVASTSTNIANTNWSVTYGTKQYYNMSMEQVQDVAITIRNIDSSWGVDYEFHILSQHSQLLRVKGVITGSAIGAGIVQWTGNVTMEALFIGETVVYVELRRLHHDPERSRETMKVIITRPDSFMDEIYKTSVGVLVFILYINFGAVLDLYALKRIILRPIGPAIGIVGQFLCMPILSFLIGYFVFPEEIALRLGLLFTGCTPGGGFSNIFTVVLNGNINLSVTMTTFSNLVAFGMMPLWIFTLGSLILEDANFVIPYETIATMSVSLLVPLSMGIALQKYAPRWTARMCKHLQPISFVLIIFVLGFTFTINSYMFTMLSWTIILACSSLPWIGYVLGYVLALLFKQSPSDAITIAIETGIQNTSIAIFMLSFTLPQPQADITSVIPVTNFLLTPVPLIILYVVRRLCCLSVTEEQLPQDEELSKEPAEYELAMLENGDKGKIIKKPNN